MHIENLYKVTIDRLQINACIYNTKEKPSAIEYFKFTNREVTKYPISSEL